MLSIARSMGKCAGYGENRINTAHFYGEAETPSGGPLNRYASRTYELWGGCG
jgi:hypothetical protein